MSNTINSTVIIAFSSVSDCFSNKFRSLDLLCSPGIKAISMFCFLNCVYGAYMQESSVSLRSIPSKTVGPEGLLYVHQCEFAVVASSSGRH